MSSTMEKTGVSLPQELHDQLQNQQPQAEDGDPPPKAQASRGVRFWGIFACLCILAFLSALDVAIITTALPTVIADIGGATEYI